MFIAEREGGERERESTSDQLTAERVKPNFSFYLSQSQVIKGIR